MRRKKIDIKSMLSQIKFQSAHWNEAFNMTFNIYAMKDAFCSRLLFSAFRFNELKSDSTQIIKLLFAVCSSLQGCHLILEPYPLDFVIDIIDSPKIITIKRREFCFWHQSGKVVVGTSNFLSIMTRGKGTFSILWIFHSISFTFF